LEERIAGLEALLVERDKRIEDLLTTVNDLRRQAEAAAVDRHELLMLSQRQQITIEALTPKLPPPSEDGATFVAPEERRPWWRWW